LLTEKTRTSHKLANELTLKKHFVDRAKALCKQPEIFRCKLVTSLINETVPFGVRADADILEAAYGDATGQDYWQAHLSEPMLVGAFAYLLSVHSLVNAEQLEDARIATILALRDAAAVDERWFIGDTTGLLAFGHPHRNSEALSDVKVRPRAAVDWLLRKPQREHLVPGSLRGFLDVERAGSTAPNKPRPLTRKNAERFATEYINSEKAAGRRPTLVGLEAAARKAGLRGGREHLRDAFRHSPDVVVTEGRPSKLAK
jgi:hypothetical protein